uniref:Uncharacterized protein n=1 Tax=Oryza nivara TaxID=4536 RepID=A0A0E0GFK8_ORYNI
MTRCSRRLLCSLFLAAAALCGVTSAAAPRLGHHLPVHVPGLRPQAGRHHQRPHAEPHHQRRLEGQYRHQHQELAADGERRHPLAQHLADQQAVGRRHGGHHPAMLLRSALSTPPQPLCHSGCAVAAVSMPTSRGG